MVCLCTDLCRPLSVAVVGTRPNRFLQALFSMQRFQPTHSFRIAAIDPFCYEAICFRGRTVDS